MKVKKLNFWKEKSRFQRLCHGGLKGSRKTRRPVSYARPMHIVFKSSMAKGRLSFLNKKNAGYIKNLASEKARSKGLRLKRYENYGSHIHIIVELKIKNRRLIGDYLRTLSSLITRHVIGCEKGRPKKINFWDGRPFSQILSIETITRKNINAFLSRGNCSAPGFEIDGLSFLRIYGGDSG